METELSAETVEAGPTILVLEQEILPKTNKVRNYRKWNRMAINIPGSIFNAKLTIIVPLWLKTSSTLSTPAKVPTTVKLKVVAVETLDRTISVCTCRFCSHDS